MAGPVFVGAGSGVAALAGSATVSKTLCSAGSLIFIDLVIRGLSEDWSAFSSVTNLELLDGTDGDVESIITGTGTTGISHALFVGRAIANGTCSAAFTVGASGEDMYARMYEFSGGSLGTTQATVLENGAQVRDFGAGISASVLDAGVTTLGSNRLATSWNGLASNQAIGNFTGESGGDWTEAVAEYQDATGSTATLQLQTAVMSSPGLISGGSVAVSSVAWSVISLAIISAPGGGPGDNPPIGVLGRGAGW